LKSRVKALERAITEAATKSDIWRVENEIKQLVNKKVALLKNEILKLVKSSTERENDTSNNNIKELTDNLSAKVSDMKKMFATKLKEMQEWTKAEIKALQDTHKKDIDVRKILKDNEELGKKLEEATKYIEANKEIFSTIESHIHNFNEWKKENATKLLNLEANSKSYLNAQKFIWERVRTACEKNIRIKDNILKQFTYLATQLEINKRAIIGKMNSLFCDSVIANKQVHKENDNKREVYKDYNVKDIREMDLTLRSDLEGFGIDNKSLIDELSFTSEEERTLIPFIKESKISVNKDEVIKSKFYLYILVNDLATKNIKKISEVEDKENEEDLDESFKSAISYSRYLSIKNF